MMRKPATGAFSWNTHALLTRAALHSATVPGLDEKCPVLRLEDFLSVAGSELQEIARRYWNLVQRKTGRADVRRLPSKDIRTVSEFLDAFGLHPDYRIHYVRLCRFEEISPEMPHDPGRSGPPGGSYVETDYRDLLSAREILCVFSDEPDWGMDQDLFTIDRYGYGPCPFGADTGLSSQAPFHMAFLFENSLLMRALPRLGRSFMEERIRVFFALAQSAFGHGITYWGRRFTAWAMHYLQDLAQPYHARPFPFHVWRILRRIAKTGLSRNFAETNKNLLRNRHILFEAAVHFILNHAVKSHSPHPFLQAPIGDGDSSAGTIPEVMRQGARVAARAAIEANLALEELIADPRLDDPEYSAENDVGYRIEERIRQAEADRPEAYERFVRVLVPILKETGKVTRFSVPGTPDINELSKR